MRAALAILIFLIAGLMIGPLWSGNTGYVLISVGNYTVELSLVAAVIIIASAVLVLRQLWRGVMALVRGTTWGMRWFGQRRDSKAKQAFDEAIEALLGNDYRAAQHGFARAWQLRKSNDDALLSAYAASQQQDYQQAKEWLAKGSRASDLTLIRTLIDLRALPQLNKAQQQQLTKLLQQYPQHPQLLRLAMQTYVTHHHWRALLDLLPALAKQKLVTHSELDNLTEQAYKEVMLEIGRSRKTELHAYWKSLSRDLRRQAPIRRAYLSVLKTFGEDDVAGKVAARGLKRGELELAKLIEQGLLVPSKELRDYLQDGLKRHPDHPFMLHALGQIALAVKDYALASRALKRASELEPSPQVWLDLAAAYQALGNNNDALTALRKGSAQV